MLFQNLGVLVLCLLLVAELLHFLPFVTVPMTTEKPDLRTCY